ncbi:MAG: hypothetical protein ACETWK_05045 [Candidatus Aminicenantaceae bacterium]
MKFFFVRDYRHKYRYFSSEPQVQIQVRFSRWKEIWDLAKKKLMLLPQRILCQEQAFRRALSSEKKVTIFHSGCLDKKRIRSKFRFFLRKQKTKHVLLLSGEILLLPLSGLAAILPGPNVFFGVLALLMITHWQALRGINRLLKKEYEFVSSTLFNEWEAALDCREETKFPKILKEIEEEHFLDSLRKILWK